LVGYLEEFYPNIRLLDLSEEAWELMSNWSNSGHKFKKKTANPTI
jgi:hypothetical protein